jgi:prepilin-type N-terminal cleavage/methylation domain-containing protein
MELKRSNSRAAQGAFTLAEVMVASAIGVILLLFAGSFYLFSMRSFASLSNYTDLNSQSRHASDLISRDLRSALSVQSLVGNQLVLNEPGGTNCTYTYDAARGTLTRNDGTWNQVLLTGIVPNSFAFSFYGRSTNASPAYEVFPTNAPNGAKLVGFRWSCLRPGAGGAPANSGGLQTNLVTLRNQ